ncbi:MAG: LLM class flavin-dependent oxidoreductase [Actinobacteria bacterium]|nr:LLM class flavin-dependent oxidoreductase [Actinomycetota bacterium]
MSDTRQAVLLFTPEWNGMHPGAWRLDGTPTDGAMDLAVVKSIVQQAEAAKFHGFFLADPTGFRLDIGLPGLARTGTAARFEPFTLMAAMAMVTERLGLIMTAGTTYEEPYMVARRFASLDHLSGGRAGWNIVTTGTKGVARHFGRDELMAHDLRYERGIEFVEAVLELWDSFDDDAFPRDKESGVFFDVDKLHVARRAGAHISLEGPLNVARPLQGHPVLAQAGSSPVGQDFAARFAEVMFTLQPTVAKARAFREGMRAKVAAYGRRPDSILILPALTLVVAPTDAEAQRKFDQMDALVPPEVGVELLSSMIDHDLSGHDVDGPLPDIPETELGTKTVQKFFVDKARDDDLTIRELISFMLRWGAVGGSPRTIADHIEEWVREGACDGFNVTFADMPESMDLFCAEVVPELQRRGVFQTEYRGRTLRENLGLERPASVFAGEAVK